MKIKPKSGYETTAGMNYFPRMLDKIRLQAREELHPDFHANLGLATGGDGVCCAFLRVPYAELRERVLSGGTDEEILQWCLERGGRKLDPIELMLWNEFSRKLGWNDRVTPSLIKLKAESGLSDRDDIATIFDYCEVDEGRKP
jgi:gluconokinase